MISVIIGCMQQRQGFGVYKLRLDNITETVNVRVNNDMTSETFTVN